MDPLTLFALANAAVSAVKAGCKLYKDIKGAAGDVKDVLKDLDAQFNADRGDQQDPRVSEVSTSVCSPLDWILGGGKTRSPWRPR